MTQPSLLNEIVKHLPKAESQFAECLTVSLSDLQLEIKDIGTISLPITQKDARLLFGTAEPAKFGLKDKTIYDQKIRDTREILARNIKISGKTWGKDFNKALRHIALKLGFGDEGKLKAHLHNLLIYEKGNFFARHQDSEKYENMVASLVVTLPSVHSGGHLIVEQCGVKKNFDSEVNNDEAQFIAFYADCYHEVKKVTAGHRVVLTFNLVLETENSIQKIKKTDENLKLTAAFKKYFDELSISTQKDNHNLLKFVLLLDHQYTQASLSWNTLKGNDKFRVQTLLSVAKQLELDAYLGFIEYHDTWSARCENDDDYNYYSRYDKKDESSQSKVSEDECELDELIDSNYLLKSLLDENGTFFEVNDFYTIEDEIAWTSDLENYKPFDTEYEGNMGNYGNTFDRWYNRTALILWPKKRHFEQLYSLNSKNSLMQLFPFFSSDLMFAKEALKKCLEISEKRSCDLEKIHFKVAHACQDSKIAFNLIAKECSIPNTNTQWNKFAKLVTKYGESWGLECVNEWIKNSYKKDQFKKMPTGILEFNFIKMALLKNQWSSLQTEIDSDYNKDSKYMLAQVARIAFLLTNGKKDLRFTQDILNFLQKKDFYRKEIRLSQILKSIQSEIDIKSDIYRSFFDYVMNQLQKITASKPKDNDWSFNPLFTCKCGDCPKLQSFLSHPIVKTLDWPLAKARRQHIHQILDRQKIQVEHTTLRKGSPHILQLKKLQALIDYKKKYYAACLKHLNSLSSLGEKGIV